MLKAFSTINLRLSDFFGASVVNTSYNPRYTGLTEDTAVNYAPIVYSLGIYSFKMYAVFHWSAGYLLIDNCTLAYLHPRAFAPCNIPLSKG